MAADHRLNNLPYCEGCSRYLSIDDIQDLNVLPTLELSRHPSPIHPPNPWHLVGLGCFRDGRTELKACQGPFTIRLSTATLTTESNPR